MTCTGAGIILYIDNSGTEHISSPILDKEILYFFLEREDNQLDFPKGGIDEEEKTPLECAVRETKEEANLSESDYDLINPEKNFFKCGKGLIMFVGKMHPHALNHVQVMKNLKTQEYEHKKDGCRFLKKEEAVKKLLPYLRDSLEWADKIIQK